MCNYSIVSKTSGLKQHMKEKRQLRKRELPALSTNYHFEALRDVTVSVYLHLVNIVWLQHHNSRYCWCPSDAVINDHTWFSLLEFDGVIPGARYVVPPVIVGKTNAVGESSVVHYSDEQNRLGANAMLLTYLLNWWMAIDKFEHQNENFIFTRTLFDLTRITTDLIPFCIFVCYRPRQQSVVTHASLACKDSPCPNGTPSWYRTSNILYGSHTWCDADV